MIKNDLVNRVTEETGVARIKAARAVETIIETMRHSLATGRTHRAARFRGLPRQAAQEGDRPEPEAPGRAGRDPARLHHPLQAREGAPRPDDGRGACGRTGRGLPGAGLSSSEPPLPSFPPPPRRPSVRRATRLSAEVRGAPAPGAVVAPRPAPPPDVRDDDLRRDPARRRVRPATRPRRPAFGSPRDHPGARPGRARLLRPAPPHPPRARARALPHVPAVRPRRLAAVLPPLHPHRPASRDVRGLHPGQGADPRQEGPLRHGRRGTDRRLPRRAPIRRVRDPPHPAQLRAARRGDDLLRLPARR